MIFEDITLVHRNDVEMDFFDYKALDLIEERFQAFTVINQEIGPDIRYKLECSCGTHIWKTIDEINDAALLNCGYCPVPVEPREKGPRTGRVRIMGILRGAIQRCHNPNASGYNNYGGRGIRVCWE